MEHYKQLWIETFTGDLKRKHDLPLFASVLLKDNNESHIKTCNLCHCQHTIVENGRICQFVPVILIISQSPTPQSTTLLFHSGWANWEDKCKNRQFPSWTNDLIPWFHNGWGARFHNIGWASHRPWVVPVLDTASGVAESNLDKSNLIKRDLEQ